MNEETPTIRRLDTGQVCATAAIAEAVKTVSGFAEFISGSLALHICGVWGDVDREDQHTNDMAYEQGEGRIISAYVVPASLAKAIDGLRDDKLWIITESDRSATTLLWPSEY